jgi:hypothetical protein
MPELLDDPSRLRERDVARGEPGFRQGGKVLDAVNQALRAEG